MNDMPWLASYPAGVRWDTTLAPTPMQQILDDTAARFPDHAALQHMGKRITYRELQGLANRCAKGLQQLGVKPGVHVGLYLPNTPHYVIAFFGTLKAGGTVVNYSPLDAAKVLEHKVEDSRTDFLFTLDLAMLYPQMDALLGKTRLKKLIVGNLAEMTAAPEAVAALAALGVHSAMLTGDGAAPAQAVAAQLSLNEVRAGLLPQDKLSEIEALQTRDGRVGMVGDGINDAPALAAADVSFAIGAGSDVAIEAADLTLVRNDLDSVADAISLSRATLGKIRQNLFFAFVYNVLGIPAAALGLLNPVIAGAAMAMSSVSVVSNSLLLRRWKPKE